MRTIRVHERDQLHLGFKRNASGSGIYNFMSYDLFSTLAIPLPLVGQDRDCVAVDVPVPCGVEVQVEMVGEDVDPEPEAWRLQNVIRGGCNESLLCEFDSITKTGCRA